MSSNFLTAIHIMRYLAYPGNAGAPAAHITSFVAYAGQTDALVTSDQIAGVFNTNELRRRDYWNRWKKIWNG